MSKIPKLALDHGADSQQMLELFIEEMLEAHRGQGMEIWWRENHVCPTLQQYLLMVERSMLIAGFGSLCSHLSTP